MLDVLNFLFEMVDVRSLPPAKIPLSIRNEISKRMHGRRRGIRVPSIDNIAMTPIIIQSIIFKAKNFI